VVFPSLGGDWGLGPTFITDRCSGCHVNGGRGAPPDKADEQLASLLVRLSIPGTDAHGGPKPHPNYGDQFQNHGLNGDEAYVRGNGDRAPPEGSVYLEWETRTVALADGEQVSLRKPKPRFENLNFGPLGDDIRTSLRLAAPVFGLGLLEAVPDDEILAEAARQAGRPVHGHVNMVWDAIREREAVGRFGWKANVPTIKQQIAAAFLGDMGVTSSLYIEDNCPPVQEACRLFTPNNRPELVDAVWDELEFWTLGLGVPAARRMDDPAVERGRRLFDAAGCAACHRPEMRTAKEFPRLPQLAGQVFHAYTDLLVHDMGPELADGRPDYQAGPSEWRTAPLWGLGLSATVNGRQAMLHDGRARDATEAILWHGGEAGPARDAFARMSADERRALLAFLDAI
jgi:CxxC motif-containing protein (DUF1111 family)